MTAPRSAERRRALRGLVGAAAVGVALAATPGVALGAGQSVTGTIASTLGLGVPTPVVLTPLTPGSTSTGTGTVAVVANLLDSWVMRVSDADPATPGRLRRTAGSGAAALAQPLAWISTPLLGTGGSGTLTGTPAVAASGTGIDTVAMGYSQPVGSGESLATGATYGLTVTVTVSAL